MIKKIDGIESEIYDNDVSTQSASLISEENTSEKSLDVVLVTYPNDFLLDLVTEELNKTCEMIFEKSSKQGYENTRVYLVSFLGDPITSDDGKLYIENTDEAAAAIDKMKVGITTDISSTMYMLTYGVNCVNNEIYPELRTDSEKYCFIIDAFGSPACDYEHSGIEKLKANGVEVYFECNSGNENYLKYVSLSSDSFCGEIAIETGRYNFGDFVVENIFTEQENVYLIISAVGWKRVVLYIG